jgi:hypothetical protein
VNRLIAGLAVLLSVSAVAGTINSGWPPEGPVRNDVTITKPVHFTHSIELYCGKAPEGYHFSGCVRDGELTLPNPCDPAYSHEKFAKLACHELAHLNGWPGDHPRPWPRAPNPAG